MREIYVVNVAAKCTKLSLSIGKECSYIKGQGILWRIEDLSIMLLLLVNFSDIPALS